MGQAVCGEGHAYTPVNGCPTCRAMRRERGWPSAARRRELRAAGAATSPPVVGRGVPKQVEDDPWREQAACLHEEGDAWFADRRDAEAREHALAVCAGCPVLDACRDYARRTRQPWGICGGETAHQRGTAYVIRYSRL